MLGFVHKTLILHRTRDCFRQTLVRHLQTLPSRKSISDDSSTSQSLTVSYLRDSCGLSLESSVSASKSIQIHGRERADAVLELFTAYGFTKSHLATLISRAPTLLLCDPVKTLKPKLEFFKSLGFVGIDLAKMLQSDRCILFSSLNNRIIPNIGFLKALVKTNEKLIAAIKRYSRVVRCNFQKEIVPKIEILRVHGIPEQNIVNLLVMQPISFFLTIDMFEKVISEIRDMGFDPRKQTFGLAVRGVAMEINWGRKKELFISLGWSENEVLSAFVKQPACMWCSEKKITKVMDFIVNKVGLEPSDVARCPNLFLASLERRIIPRCLVLQVLMSRGLIKNKVDLVWILNVEKKIFESRFLIPFEDGVPEVIKAYRSEIGFQGFNNGLKLSEIHKSSKVVG